MLLSVARQCVPVDDICVIGQPCVEQSPAGKVRWQQTPTEVVQPPNLIPKRDARRRSCFNAAAIEQVVYWLRLERDHRRPNLSQSPCRNTLGQLHQLRKRRKSSLPTPLIANPYLPIPHRRGEPAARNWFCQMLANYLLLWIRPFHRFRGWFQFLFPLVDCSPEQFASFPRFHVDGGAAKGRAWLHAGWRSRPIPNDGPSALNEDGLR